MQTREKSVRGGLPHQVRRNSSIRAADCVRAAINVDRHSVVHCEGYYMTSLVPDMDAPIILIEHNVEFELEQQRASVTGNQSHAVEAGNILDWEQAAWRRARACGFLTLEDLATAREIFPRINAALTPNGRPDQCFSSQVRCASAPRLVLPGNFGYGPTEDCALHFLESLFPRIRARIPDVVGSLVGAAPSMRLKAAANTQNVEVTGRVESLTPWLHAADLVVCPLRIGGGIKMKMLDSIAHGVPIVTTALGAQGLSACSNAFRIARTEGEFVDLCVNLLRNPHSRRDLAAQCREAWHKLPTWEDAADAVDALYQSAIR